MGTPSGYQSRAEGDAGPDLRGEPQDAPSSFSAALNYRWETCIDAIGKEAWDACFGTRNVYDSFELAQAVEKSRLPGVDNYYLVGERAGKAVFLLPCFRIRVSLSMLAPPALQPWIARVRWLFPNALYFTAFIGGLPMAVCKDSLGMQRLSPPERPRVLREVKQLLLKQGRRVQAGFVVFKEIKIPQMELIRAALVPEFHVIESCPTMYLPISLPGCPGYVERLRSKQRQLVRKRRRMFTEAGLRWETAVDFERYADQFMPLYLQVLERAKDRLETLTPDFFREVSRRLGERSFALLCFKGEELIAFELFLKDEEWLQPMYLGLNYAYRVKGSCTSTASTKSSRNARSEPILWSNWDRVHTTPKASWAR